MRLGELPEDTKEARRLVLESSKFDLIDGMYELSDLFCQERTQRHVQASSGAHPGRWPISQGCLQLPQILNGNQYIVVFMDYLMKWPEAFPMADQKTETIAWLFVNNILCRHGIPEELLSDRGSNFLSDMIFAMWQSQHLNSMLLDLIAKCCESRSRDWNEQILGLE